MAKRGNGGGFSLRPEDGVEGGGTEGATATLAEVDFVQEYTYGGRYKDNPSAALHIVFEIDGFEKPWDQHYSVGPSDKYEVTDDGDSIKSTGKQSGLNKKCPAFALLSSISVAADAAAIDIDELVTPNYDGTYSIAGLRGKRVTLTNEKLTTVGGDEKEYIVIASFLDDEAPTKSNNGKGSAKSSAKATKPSSSDEIEEKTIEAIKALIEEHTTVKKSDVANLVYQNHKKDVDAKAMMQMAFKESWLAAQTDHWSYDKKKGVLREAE